MKEQLNPILRFFYFIPISVSIVLFFVFLFLSISAADNSPLFALFSFLTIFCFIAIFGKNMANNKIQKLKLGLNPAYLIKKYPKNLEQQVNFLIQNEKFQLVDKTETTARLERKPSFSILSAIVFFLLGIIPGVIYVVWYLAKPKEIVFLDIKSQT